MELTARNKGDQRGEIWAKKRLFFCTPDMLNVDLKRGKCPSERYTSLSLSLSLSLSVYIYNIYIYIYISISLSLSLFLFRSL